MKNITYNEQCTRFLCASSRYASRAAFRRVDRVYFMFPRNSAFFLTFFFGLLHLNITDFDYNVLRNTGYVLSR